MTSMSSSVNGLPSDVVMQTITLPNGSLIRIPIKQPTGNQQPVLMSRVEMPSEMSDEIGKIAQEGVEENVSDEVFSSFQHYEILPGCKAHPADIVEAGSLAAVSLPKPEYPLQDSIPPHLIDYGKLSSLQLEGICYACQRHQIVLPNGNRAGFFLGDGAGVGKGRQIAGIILDNYARKRTKHIWFSISADLIVDARRDLCDIGCHMKVIEGCKQLDKETKVFGLPAGFKDGVIFSTYATLVSSVQKGGIFNSSKQSRMKQLVDWCGEDFNGCLIFDECHKAKNFIPGKEHASTKVALAVAAIQTILPKARVVYCSATGVSDVKNMAFMERLGLWGDGAPFKSFEHFLDSVHKKGLGVAEMLAMEMKASGMYLSRGLSFKEAEFVTLEASLTADQIKMFDTAAHLWNEVRKSLNSALQRTGSNNNRIWSLFWSCHQRFFKQLCLGLKVPTIIKEVESALAEGHCVVIGLQTTGESSLETEMVKNGINGFMSVCREIFTRFVEQHFPTEIENALNVEKQEDPWSIQAKSMLINFAKQITLPISSLDEIIDKCGGPYKVAEMTGRRGRIVQKSSITQYELRGSESYDGIESLNVRERNMFMEGKKLIAIISDAASTGISLHADERADNHRRRIHLTIELPWSADKAVQQLGRSHRANQTSGPLYKLLTTDLGGERRFAAAVAKRLQSLGALTKGDRRAATGADLGEFNFDTPYGRNALRSMYSSILHKQLFSGVSLTTITGCDMDFNTFNTQMQSCLVLMGVLDETDLLSGAGIKEKEAGDVSRFLNRILGLAVSKQNIIFNYFTECLHVVIQNAKKEGRYNEGLLDITATSIQQVGKARPVFKESALSTSHVMITVDRGMSWDMAMVRKNNHTQRDDGFYCSRRETRGKKLYLLATQKENSTHLFKIARPNTGVSAVDEEKVELAVRYVPIDSEKAEVGWREQHESALKLCIHGPHCKNRPHCTAGTRTYKLHLLCGGIVGLMNLLELTVAQYATRLQLSKLDCNLRVVRVKLDTGERLVGLRYPEMLIPLAEKAFREQRALGILSQKTLDSGGQLQSSTQKTGAATCNLDATPTAKILKEISQEPVTPISAKHLGMAVTPPVTIEKFFRPKNETANIGKEVDLNPSCNGSIETAYEDTEDTSIDNKQEIQNEHYMSNTIKQGNIVPKKGTKRLLDNSDDSNAKKMKQSNIMSSFIFQKKKSDQKKKKKDITCPICQKEFDPKISNKNLNDHIDNCLL